jgi:mandelate racemase
MKITSFLVRCVQVPMEAHRTASGTVSVSPLVLLTVRTDEGVEGHGIVFSYLPAALKPLGDLVANLEPLVAGQELAPMEVSDRLRDRFRMLGAQGLTGMALAGIDMALWDAAARAAEMPLHRLLGASAKPIPAYAGVGFDGVEGSARAAEQWAKRGFRAVKAKIGYPTLEQDIAVVRAMRSAVGPGVQLMVDYNQSLAPDEAARRLRALDGEGLAWIEEPVLAHDFAALAWLQGEVRTPLQAGENWWGPLDFRHAIDAGVRGQAYGLALSSHLWPELSAQLLCATRTAHWLEHVEWWNPILQEPLDVRDGMAQVSTAAGSGVAFDEEAVQRYLA